MTKNFQKFLQDYLSKVKKPPTNWILRGCKNPKTPSVATVRHQDGNEDDDAVTSSDIDRFLFENFKSLYLNEEYKEEIENKEDKSSAFLFDSPRFFNPPPNLCGSHRFFVAAGSSGSLIEEARTSEAASEDTATTVNDSSRVGDDRAEELTSPDDFITVLTYSPSPYDDFRRSMQEMVEARLRRHGRVNWEFMEELLFCYLNLNDNKSYKYVLSAFVDLVVVLRENSGGFPARSPVELRQDHGVLDPRFRGERKRGDVT